MRIFMTKMRTTICCCNLKYDSRKCPLSESQIAVHCIYIKHIRIVSVKDVIGHRLTHLSIPIKPNWAKNFSYPKSSRTIRIL